MQEIPTANKNVIAIKPLIQYKIFLEVIVMIPLVFLIMTII